VVFAAPGIHLEDQCHWLSEALGACPLTISRVLQAARECSARPYSALAKVREYEKRGDPVPDHVVLNLVRERRRCFSCSGGFLLHGFPRTISQARALDALLAIEAAPLDAAINYELSHDKLMARLCGRRVCARCRAEYYLEEARPRLDGICDGCGGALEEAPEDRPEQAELRLQSYANITSPLLEHYEREGLLVSVLADGSPGEILARTLDALVGRELVV
jgi:adenylate kinase